MKCVYLFATKEIIRVSDGDAYEIVTEKKGEYKSKAEWKTRNNGVSNKVVDH